MRITLVTNLLSGESWLDVGSVGEEKESSFDCAFASSLGPLSNNNAMIGVNRLKRCQRWFVYLT